MPLTKEAPSPAVGLSQELQQTHLSQGKRVSGIEEKERSFLTRAFVERGLSKTLHEQRVEEVKEWHRYRSDMFRLAADTKLDMCHETCLKMSRELKVSNRQEFAGFVTSREEELRHIIQSKLETFLAEMDHAYSLAEKFQHRPFLAERHLAMIETTITNYFDFTEGLMDNFISIARERVNEYRITD